MCRFKLKILKRLTISNKISIHLMCRFKIINIYYQKILADFNTSYVSVQEKREIEFKIIKLFQYILCVGSRFYKLLENSSSYEFQYILCVGSRTDSASHGSYSSEFQYILCVGSSVPLPFCSAVPPLFQYILCVGSRRQKRW